MRKFLAVGMGVESTGIQSHLPKMGPYFNRSDGDIPQQDESDVLFMGQGSSGMLFLSSGTFHKHTYFLQFP